MSGTDPQAECAARLWSWCQQWRPRHTEAHVAKLTGADERTVRGWRYKFPSNRHWMAMAAEWGPPFTNYVLEPLNERFAEHRLAAELVDIDRRLDAVKREFAKLKG